MTSLVTGGAGFIGAEVVRLLLNKGEKKPVVFSRNPATPNIADFADQVEAISGDLGVFSHVLGAVERTRPDAIYHLGAMLPGGTEGDVGGAIQTNVMGTFHVLEAARLFGVRKVLFASSFGVYGDGIADEAIGDFAPQFPRFMYGITKTFGEQIGLYYKRNYGIDFRGIRYPFIHGAGPKPGRMAGHYRLAVEESVKGNPYTIQVPPELRQPILYIKDASRGIVLLAEAPAENIKTVNYVLNGITPSPNARELAEVVTAKLPGARIDFKLEVDPVEVLGDVFRPYDDRRAREEWGWTVEYDLERMVDELIREFAQVSPH